MKWLLLLGGLWLTSSAAGDGVRDPTRPPLAETRTSQTVAEAAPVLSAVLNFNGVRTAIFNGQLVRSGSSLAPTPSRPYSRMACATAMQG